MVQETIKSSLTYGILHRLGVEDDKLDSMVDFKHLGKFKDLSSLCCIGEAVSSLAKPILIDIEKTTHRMEKKRAWER